MAEHLRHRLEARPAGQRQGRGTVAEVMQPDGRQTSVSREPLEVAADVCRTRREPLPRPRRQQRRQNIEALLRNDLIICDEVGFAALDSDPSTR
jgi:hypothetical protein